MSLAEIIAIFVSVAAFVIAFMIAFISDHRVRALTKLEFDEKLAMMAEYRKMIEENGLYVIEQCKKDLLAVSNLKTWAPRKKKEELINGHILPIIKTAVERGPDAGVANHLKELIEIASQFGVSMQRFRELQEELESIRAYHAAKASGDEAKGM